MDTKVTAEEMVDELLQVNANLTMQLAAAQVLIRKLQAHSGETNGKVQSGLVDVESGNSQES